MSRGLRRRGWFVAGTGTGVGKTVVSAALVSWLRANSIQATYLKPVSTDGQMVGQGFVSPDAIWVKSVCELDTPVGKLNPICWSHPLSPLASARMEKSELSWDEVLQKVADELDVDTPIVCEGVGGVMVPLCEGKTVLDLMVELGFSVLLVARPDLGTINHSLLSIDAMAARGLDVLGFVFSGSDSELGSRLHDTTNSRLIEEFSGVTFLGELPWIEPLNSASLVRAVGKNFDLESFVMV